MVSQLLRKAKEQDLIMPTYQSQASEENFEGATVIDPVKGESSCNMFIIKFLVAVVSTVHIYLKG